MERKTGIEDIFLAEGSLAPLVKNLRILGIDCKYDGGLGVADAINVAICSSRTLITTRNIPQTAQLKVSRVIEASTREQLVALVEAHNLYAIFKPFSRCLECNATLCFISPGSQLPTGADVPESVLKRGLPMYQCPTCRKLFWHGSHIERMLARLEEWGIRIPLETFKGM